MKRLAIIIMILFLSQIHYAQVKISGIVKGDNEPISFVTVVLKDSTESILTYDITDENGSFSMKIEKGNYQLEVERLGFETWIKTISADKDLSLGEISLESAAHTLGEVVVKHKVPVIERKPDRLIFNVASSVASTGGNALDALRAAPGLNVGTTGINLLGRSNVRVMLNGRFLQMSGEELVNFLNSIASDDIQKIEIISNPPAKYEASGSGGLINIIYKKGVRESWKNSSTISYSQLNKYQFASFRNNFLYRKNKFSFSGSLSGDKGHMRELEWFETFYPTGVWKNGLDIKQIKDNASGRFAVDYDLSDKTSVGIQYLGNFSTPTRDVYSLTEIFNPEGTIDAFFENNGDDVRKVNIQVANVHLVSNLDTFGRTISFDVDYFSFENDTQNDYQVDRLSAEKEYLDINQAAITLNNQFIENLSAKVDVEHPIGDFNLSYGAKVSQINSFNKLDNFNTITGKEVFDSTLSNEFDYQENVGAIYASGAQKITKKLDAKFGLRLENTQTEGFSKTTEQTNENQYLRLFPTAYLSYKKDEENVFTLSYGRRIRRPNFRILNPFRSYQNSFSYSEGNPFVQPSFDDTFLFGYTHKSVWITDAYYEKTSNGFGDVFSADPETLIKSVTRQNYYTEYRAGIGEIYVFNKIPWLYSQNQLYIMGQTSTFFNDEILAKPKGSLRYYIGTYNTFTLNKSTKFEANFFYRSRSDGGLWTVGTRYGLDLGLKKSFMDNDLQVALFAKDIFDTGSLNRLESEVTGVKVGFSSNYSRRYVRLSVSYNFGNKKINVRDRKFGNDDERGRAN